ncbi:MAG: O-methyltransferase, partial [Gammaproteobacteria bacterium]|nr:O-methyltransferase [Gammaproteobacteria bacterium]
MTAYPDLETYRRSLFDREDELLAGIMPAAVARGMPDISVNAETGQALNLLARLIGARRILEFGTLAGYSGIWLARALPPGGLLVTNEFEPLHAEIAGENFRRADVEERVRIVLGSALDVQPELAEYGPYDLVFIDTGKEIYCDALDFALEHTRPGGLILGDNTDCFGEGHKELAPDHPAYGIQVFNQRIATEKRLQSMIIPVGSWLSVSRVLENPE